MDNENGGGGGQTYPDARMLIGLKFVTGDGETGRVIGQITVGEFLVAWDDGRKTIVAVGEMRAKSEPEVDVAGKRTGKWLKGEGWTFS
jgi:hypothetical protein